MAKHDPNDLINAAMGKAGSKKKKSGKKKKGDVDVGNFGNGIRIGKVW